MKKELLRSYMMHMLNIPYIWGGDDPMKGFDCSGLACEILMAFGHLPHKTDLTAQGLADRFTLEDYKEDPKFLELLDTGDLIFYGKGQKQITHVATFLDNRLVLEAAGGGSTTVSLEMAAKQNAYVRIRPANYRSDIVGVVFL